MRKTLNEINNNILRLSQDIERLKLGEYIELINSPIRIFYSNFMWGLARGFGMAVGFTILGAVILYALKSVVWSNIPIIGRYIAEIVKIVQNNIH